MKFQLLIARVADPISNLGSRELNDSWVWIDRLSHGLASRYAWNRKSSCEDETWILMRPFMAQSPLLVAVWNSSKPLVLEDLKIESDQIDRIYWDEASISEQESAGLRKKFSQELLPWPHEHNFPTMIHSDSM